MNSFDQPNPSAARDRERPAPDDPEAQFYPPYTQRASQQSGPQRPYGSGPFGQHHHHHHYGYGPEDPDGYARPYGGGPGGPQPWQPWAWQGRTWRRHRPHRFLTFLLVLLLVVLFIKPALAFTFALAGLALTLLLILLPLALLGMFFRHRYGWGHHRGRHWGNPWDRPW